MIKSHLIANHPPIYPNPHAKPFLRLRHACYPPYLPPTTTIPYACAYRPLEGRVKIMAGRRAELTLFVLLVPD